VEHVLHILGIIEQDRAAGIPAQPAKDRIEAYCHDVLADHDRQSQAEEQRLSELCERYGMAAPTF
jgi:hypothetical protein